MYYVMLAFNPLNLQRSFQKSLRLLFATSENMPVSSFLLAKGGSIETSPSFKRATHEAGVPAHDPYTACPARNRYLLMPSGRAGMRVGEIAALSVEDVVTPGGEMRPEIQLRPDQTTGSSTRTILIGSQLRSELDAHIRSRPIKPA